MDVLETIATILIALPALLYAAGCLLNTQVMVDMLPERIPALHVLVRLLGVAFLGSGILINVDRFAEPAGWTMSGLLLVTAFGIHLPDVIKDEEPRELVRRIDEEGWFRADANVDLDMLARSLWILSRYWMDHLREMEQCEEIHWRDVQRGIQHHLAVLVPLLIAAGRRRFTDALARLSTATGPGL